MKSASTEIAQSKYTAFLGLYISPKILYIYPKKANR